MVQCSETSQRGESPLGLKGQQAVKESGSILAEVLAFSIRMEPIHSNRHGRLQDSKFSSLTLPLPLLCLPESKGKPEEGAH